MSAELSATVFYQRCRFATPLPVAFLYTPAHHWLARQPDGSWRVGLTKFATRLLGEMVEYGFHLTAGTNVRVGDAIGFVEGFKAVSELASAVSGRFLGANPALREQPDLINQDPYDAGWLYTAEGLPDPAGLDVQGYRGFLDRTIDAMRAGETGEEPR